MATTGVSTNNYTDFVPIVTIQENPNVFEKKEEKKYEKLSPAIKNKVNVSKVKIKIKVTDTFTLKFKIEKGANDANDSNGNIKAIIKLTNGSGREEIFNGKSYGETLSVTVKKEEIEEIDSIDFEYIDNEVPMIEGVKYQNCGRVVLDYCFCDRWENVSNIMSAQNFEGYRTDCLVAAEKQIKNAGYVQTWNRYQIARARRGRNNAFIEMRYYEKEFNKGVKYMKKAIKSNVPVIVGISNNEGITPGNPDKTTNHFVVIVGMGSDAIGNYFTFHDNAVGTGYDTVYYLDEHGTVSPNRDEQTGRIINDQGVLGGTIIDQGTLREIGTSINSKLYCKCDLPALIGSPDRRSPYGAGLTYTVTSIRESKKIKTASA